MPRWIENWTLRFAPNPEKQAEQALGELRLELFRAEQRVLDAQMHAAYYRVRLSFFEEVVKMGIEHVADQRRGQRETPQGARTGPKLTEVMPEVRTFG
jgi:hypothetical protein